MVNSMGKTKRKVKATMTVQEVHEYQTKFYKRNTVIEPPKFKKPKYKPKWSDQ